MATDSARDKLRNEIMDRVPAWYNPWLHLAGTTGVGLGVLALALWYMHDVTWLETLTVPLVFLFANAFEWRVHKYVLHQKAPLLAEIYHQHTPLHHGVYIMNDMEIRSLREFRLVLIPAYGVFLIVVSMAPLAYGLGRLLSPNTGWLFLLTAGLYMVMYELTHLSYHLSQNGFIGRRKIIRLLRQHHATHHEPRLMQKWNFNVSIPLFDWILGTTWRGEAEATQGTGSAPPFAGSGSQGTGSAPSFAGSGSQGTGNAPSFAGSGSQGTGNAPSTQQEESALGGNGGMSSPGSDT